MGPGEGCCADCACLVCIDCVCAKPVCAKPAHTTANRRITAIFKGNLRMRQKSLPRGCTELLIMIAQGKIFAADLRRWPQIKTGRGRECTRKTRISCGRLHPFNVFARVIRICTWQELENNPCRHNNKVVIPTTVKRS